MIRLERVIATLPAEFETLRAEAGSEGHRMLDTLAAEWASGAMRFDRPGEALLAAYAGDILAGIGGLTFEPTITGALRMRRFYVRAACRRCGAGLMLASTLLDLPRAERPDGDRQCRRRKRGVLGSARVHSGRTRRVHAYPERLTHTVRPAPKRPHS